jgi:hypothetical protein
LHVLLQSRRLKVASGLPDADGLVAELTAYQRQGKAKEPDDRQGPQQGLVLAVALAAWLGENTFEPYTGPLVYWPPVELDPAHEGSLLQEVLAAMGREEGALDPWR